MKTMYIIIIVTSIFIISGIILSIYLFNSNKSPSKPSLINTSPQKKTQVNTPVILSLSTSSIQSAMEPPIEPPVEPPIEQPPRFVISGITANKPTTELILGIGTNNHLYKRTKMDSAWELVSNTCCIKSITQLKDLSFLAVGTNDNRLYTKTNLTASWVYLMDNNISINSVVQLQDGTILAVGSVTENLSYNRNYLYTKSKITDQWVQSYPCDWCNGGYGMACLHYNINVTQLNNGTILCTGGDIGASLYTKKTLTSPWVNVSYTCGVSTCYFRSITSLQNGYLLGVGTSSVGNDINTRLYSNRLYINDNTKMSSWEYINNSDFGITYLATVYIPK